MRSRARNSRKTKGRARTIPLKGNNIRGNGEDSGKYYRCWNCGFTVDSTRDSIGGEHSGSGDNHLDFHEPAFGAKDTSDDLNSLSVLGGDIGHFEVALENVGDGTTEKIRHDFKSDMTGGCPMCGTYNYKGDYK